jgi:hypothetical protein
VGGDPGAFKALTRPSWPDFGGRRGASRQVRVAQAAKRAAKTKPLPVPTAQAQAALLDKIAKGQSNLRIDISKWTPNPAVKDTDTGREVLATGAKFQAQYMGYLKELAATPVGFKLMTELDQAKHKTTIVFDLKQLNNHTTSPVAANAVDKTKGDTPTILMNPNLTTFQDLTGRRDVPWMTEREKYGFYHEMVHAWHVSHGTQATGSHQGVDNSEWQATGFGPKADPQISDNAIRRAFGKAERPHYNDVVYK